METVSILELKRRAGPAAEALRFHAQLSRSLQRTTKGGSPFYELTFADAEASLLLRVWSNTPMFAKCAQLREGLFFEVSGEFGLGNDGRSVDGRSWTARALDEAETEALLAGPEELRRKQAEAFACIEKSCAALADPRLRMLCAAFLERYGERFRRSAGARGYHHARRGGLVEHVAQMMRTAALVCEAYPMLNRDLLLAGVLFHDVGKLWENVYEERGFAMPFNEISELISHIPLGMEIVNKLWRELSEDEAVAGSWRELEPGSGRVRLHLLHLIASHHGELAFGAPVVPKTPEAQALHYIDNLDAKMEMFEKGYETAGQLAPNVFDRVRPLEGHLVAPLPKFEGGVAAAAEEESDPAEETPAEEGAGGAAAEGREPGDGLPIPLPGDGESGGDAGRDPF